MCCFSHFVLPLSIFCCKSLSVTTISVKVSTNVLLNLLSLYMKYATITTATPLFTKRFTISLTVSPHFISYVVLTSNTPPLILFGINLDGTFNPALKSSYPLFIGLCSLSNKNSNSSFVYFFSSYCALP